VRQVVSGMPPEPRGKNFQMLLSTIRLLLFFEKPDKMDNITDIQIADLV
jgi:hypothetical protein